MGHWSKVSANWPFSGRFCNSMSPLWAKYSILNIADGNLLDLRTWFVSFSTDLSIDVQFESCRSILQRPSWACKILPSLFSHFAITSLGIDTEKVNFCGRFMHVSVSALGCVFVSTLIQLFVTLLGRIVHLPALCFPRFRHVQGWDFVNELQHYASPSGPQSQTRISEEPPEKYSGHGGP